jgi:hypothetical protein
MSFRSKLRYLYRWDLIPNRLQDRYLRYTRALPDRNYWRGLKDKYKGQAGFVIGNGPSLKIEDLTEIKKHGFVSIASNKIYLAFDQTDWRPNFYTIADNLVWAKIKDSVHNDIQLVHIASKLDKTGANTPIRYWNTLGNQWNGNPFSFSSDLSKGMNTGATITYENLQIAVYIGLNPIYIIGCDHFYEGESSHKNGGMIEQSDKQTHFIKGYRSPGEVVWSAPIHHMTMAYTSAKKYADNLGIKIYNATRGGHLEIFERVNIDDIFCNSEKQLPSSKT